MIECDCGDYEPWGFYRAEIRKARKRHRCYECRGFVEIGEKYEYSSGSYDGSISVHHTCERCYDIRVWVKNNVPCFCHVHGMLDETARDAVEDAYCRAKDEVVGLAFGLARKIYMRNRLNKERSSIKQAA